MADPRTPTNPLLQKTLTVTINAIDDPQSKRLGLVPSTFEFTIPTVHDDIRLGMKVRDLQRQLDPDWDGFAYGLDTSTSYALRACAAFEMLLKSASVTWPFTEAKSGAPVVDSSKFPADKVSDVMLAYQGFFEALSTFRSGGAPDKPPAGDEAVAGQPDTGQ